MLIIVPLTTAVLAFVSLFISDYSLAGTARLSVFETLSIASSAVYTWLPALSASVHESALVLPLGGIGSDTGVGIGGFGAPFVDTDVSVALDFLQLIGQSPGCGLWDDPVALDHMVYGGMSGE